MEEHNSQEEAEAAPEGPEYNNPRYWNRKAKEAEKIFKKRHWESAKRAWAEYQLGEEAGEQGSEAGTGERTVHPKLFPIYWSSIKTLAPAYWSKTPIPIAPVRYGITDAAARTGSKMLERLGILSLETTPLDQVMRDVTLEFIIADMGCTRVMLEGDKEMRQIPISQVEGSEEYALENGQPYTGQMVGQDDEGAWYGEEEHYDNLKCYPMALSFDDVMWTPDASCKDEVDEMFYRFCYPEHQAYEMFPNIDRDELKSAMKAYGRQKTGDIYQKQRVEADGTQEHFLHGWEVWHKPTKTVKFITDGLKGKFLKQTDDRYQLRDFFPSPCPIVATKQRKSLFGVPGYRYVQTMCEQMHEVAMRIYNLSKAIRRRYIADKAVEHDLHSVIMDGDESEYVFIKNLMDIVEAGGIRNVIMELPVKELADSIVELSQLHEKYKAEFYEIFGVPDVVRGMSDPLETAKAQEIKSFSASNRFRDQMNQIAGLGRDTLELLVDLKLGAYPAQQVLKMVGAQFMDPADQQRLGEAYALITDDVDRIVRLDFETDSTSYVNERIDQANRNVAIKTVTEGIRALNGMPPMQQTIGFKVIQSALSGMRLGKEFMDDIEQLMQTMTEQAQNPPEPQPDVEMLKLEQKAQKDKMDAFMEKRKLDQQEAKLIQESQKGQLDLAIKTRETEIKEFKVMVEKQKIDNEAQFEAVRLALEDVSTRFMMAMEQNRLSLDQFSALNDAIESQREEIRLARAANLDIVKTAADLKTSLQPVINIPEQKPAQIELTLPERKRRRRFITPIDDGMGNTRYAVDEEELD